MPFGSELPELRPLFGAGEDRNLVGTGARWSEATGCTRSSERVRIATCLTKLSMRAPTTLHPLFGAGEDRNQVLDGIDGTPVVLHPLFGAGEDRNAAEMETLLSAG